MGGLGSLNNPDVLLVYSRAGVVQRILTVPGSIGMQSLGGGFLAPAALRVGRIAEVLTATSQ
jgi:hypothetical protein